MSGDNGIICGVALIAEVGHGGYPFYEDNRNSGDDPLLWRRAGAAERARLESAKASKEASWVQIPTSPKFFATELGFERSRSLMSCDVKEQRIAAGARPEAAKPLEAANPNVSASFCASFQEIFTGREQKRGHS